MTASEKLAQLIENNKLTDGQLDNLSNWGICRVSELKGYLIDKIKELQNKTGSVEFYDVVSTLHYLLNYNNDEYVVYGESGIHKLDFDMLNDALDVD